jgi:CHAD domain-containing protein
VSPAFDEELIHEMRTTVKKMRALSTWAGTSEVTNSKYLRKLYKASGRIRDVQLLMKRIKNNESAQQPGLVLPAFTNWLEEHLHHLKYEWQLLYEKERIKKITRDQSCKHIKKNADPLSNNHSADEFIKEKGEYLDSFRSLRPLNDEQIHDGRKTIKEIQFVSRWQNKKSGTQGNVEADEKMKKLSDETGNFIDTCKGLDLLDMYIQQEEDEENRSKALELRNTWINTKEQDRNNLIAAIDLFPVLF